jgi:hypothetical protein
MYIQVLPIAKESSEIQPDTEEIKNDTGNNKKDDQYADIFGKEFFYHFKSMKYYKAPLCRCRQVTNDIGVRDIASPEDPHDSLIVLKFFH